MSRTGHIERVEHKRNVYEFWMESCGGKTSLERPRRRWENTTKMYVKEIGVRCGIDSPVSK
jgi:hypothetical protein